MGISGHVQNGVIVLDGPVSLPEGAAVTVVYPAQAAKPQGATRPVIECEPGKLPLVRSATLGSVHLTNERIQEIFDEEDIEAMKRQSNVSS
jgi:hypothetical protein